MIPGIKIRAIRERASVASVNGTGALGGGGDALSRGFIRQSPPKITLKL